MKNALKGFVALAAVSVTLGAGSAAQAAMIDFGVVASGGTISYMGGTLQSSMAIDLDGAALKVSQVSPTDASGLAIGDLIGLSPTTINYASGLGSLKTDVVKSWTDALGSFTETLNTVVSIDRAAKNAITITLGGTITGPGFASVPAELILSATQAGGPHNVISASLTNTSFSGTTTTGSTPEPSTWVMMALGFVGLGYAAVRRSSKNRSAVAIS
jgi:hypothetical protein